MLSGSADKSGMRKQYIYLSIFGMMTGCAPQFNPAVESIASNTAQDIACKNQNLETKLWDGLKSYLIEQKAIPAASEMKSAMHVQIEKLAADNAQLSSADVAKLNQDLDALVDSLLSEAPQGERVESPEQLLGLLSAIDVGDRSTVFRSYMQDRVRGNFTTLTKTIQSYDLNCNTSSGSGASSGSTATSDETVKDATPTPTPVPNYDYEYQKKQALAAGVPLAVFGERWAFATAYQTCQSLQLDPLNAKTPEMQGIAITGKHSDGVGNKRSIASLSTVQATHPYVKGVSTYGQSCFNVRQNPLIYDYGGKPYATTAATSPIDLHKNNGDGTSVLGIDCSGFVFTAMATAGLKLQSGRALRAVDSWAWGSTSYVEPSNNGLTCLAKISVSPTSTMQAGDIVAVQGHVILIDKVGADPFGIGNAKTEKDCAALNASGFDFIVAQSSPSAGAVGINRFEAKDYLPTSAKMNTGLQKYAYYTCLAKVNKKTYTPNLGTLSVVRHKGTADCVAPRVTMAHESCIQSCSSGTFAN